MAADLSMFSVPQAGAAATVRTLWFGELDSWMDESAIASMFAPEHMTIVNIKVIRDRNTGAHSGYGFIEFVTRENAERVLSVYNGQPIPIYPAKKFRLQWAQYGVGDRRPDTGAPLFSAYVGDLDPQVTDQLLESTFRNRFPSVVAARVVTEAGTLKPKGFGFVRFGDENDCKRAVQEMNNVVLCGRPMRVGLATPKQQTAAAMMSMPTITKAEELLVPKAPVPAAVTVAVTRPVAVAEDPSDMYNTTVFVGNLSPTVTPELLRSEFELFGELDSINIPKGKNCGFVQFKSHESADAAIKSVQGRVIGGTSVRLSWGKSAALKRQVPMAPTLPTPAPPTLYGFGSAYPTSYSYYDYYGSGQPTASAGPMFGYSAPPMAPIPMAPVPIPNTVIAPVTMSPVSFGAQWIAQMDMGVMGPAVDPYKVDPRANMRFVRQHAYHAVLPFADSSHFADIVKRSVV